jgi:hypothetical protein
MTSESAAQAAIREAAAYIGITLFRNNSGALPDKTGRIVRFGLHNETAQANAAAKSSDLIGWHEPSGRFVSIEVKAPGWRGPRTDRELAQQRWIDAVRRAGGIAGFATCVGDLYAVVEQCA